MLLSGVGGGIWVGIVSEIWNNGNRVVFENRQVDLMEVFYCGTKEDLVLGHSKRKIG